MRVVVLIALFSLLIPPSGTSQLAAPAGRFFENGQPTRTGPDAAMFPDAPARSKLDLAGQWNYSTDGKTWLSTVVPSAYDFPGRVTFQRSFEVKSEMLDAYVFSLVAYGINYQCDISINGDFVGHHSGGYTSFVIPIARNVLQVGKDNAISIVVDNELTPKTTLPLKQQVGGWRTYGGIFRDIYILATPKLYIEDADNRTELSAETKNSVVSAKIFVSADVMNRGSEMKAGQVGSLGFQVEAYDKLSGELVGRSGITPIVPQSNKSISATAGLTLLSPKLWSPETPDLYVLKYEIVQIVNKEVSVLDEYDADLGIRDVRWIDGRLYLNNTMLPLRGILWQEDDATFASAMTYGALERDVALIKSLGANLIRFLYPPHPYMLNLCDRYGLFVIEGIPFVGVPAEILTKDYYQELATIYAREMVERDKQHACVLAWGIGDEFETGSTVSCEFVNDMRNVIRSLDKRSVFFATSSLKDPCFEYADLIALNSYGDEPKKFREALQQCKAAYPEKPIIVARYGRAVEPGNHNGYSDPLSMESQARYAMQFFNLLQDAKIAGGVLWSFNDWFTDRAALTTHSQDPYLHSMGIVSSSREKRTAFDVVRALFSGEKVQALPVGNYSSNAPIIFVIAGFFVLISFAFVYNANRRFRDCVNRSLFRTYNFFADVRDQRLLTYGQSVFLAAIISVTWAIVLGSIFSHYRDDLFLDNLLSQFLFDDLKEWFVRLVWNPLKFIVVSGGLIFICVILLSAIVKTLSAFVKTHVNYYHALSVTVWAALPYIIFIPISMILFRLMETEVYVWPVLVLIFIVSLWVMLRLFKGISIIYDVFPVRVYAVGLLVIILTAAAVYGYFDYTESTTVYLRYIIQTMKHSMRG